MYGASEGLRTVLVEREAPGGQAGQSSRIENYLGFPAGVSGSELARRATAQARQFGAEIITVQDACRLEHAGCGARGASGGRRASSARTASSSPTGVAYRRLDAPGMDKLTGRGVYYGAALAEAQRVSGQDVYLVGGANSAGQAAVYFARFARQVTLLVRADRLEKSMSQYLIDQVRATAEYPRTSSTRGRGSAPAKSTWRQSRSPTARQDPSRKSRPTSCLSLSAPTRTPTGSVRRSPVTNEASSSPGPDLLRDGTSPRWALEREPLPLETSLPGVFVAGDVRRSSMKRVASAVGEGAMARPANRGLSNELRGGGAQRCSHCIPTIDRFSPKADSSRRPRTTGTIEVTRKSRENA